MKYKSGMHTTQELAAISRDETFLSLKSYSDRFISANSEPLQEYRWIKDSLNQWSRIYEYPYCFQKLNQELSDGAAVLDAGSGLTFFPFILASRFNVTCVDQDDYSSEFSKINRTMKSSVSFTRSSLVDIPRANQSFDAIYCISVLEHTDNRTDILNEFSRLLKPGGMIVVTFDVAMNKRSEGMAISMSETQNLIADIKKRFVIDETDSQINKDPKSTNMYSLRKARQILPAYMMPWQKPSIATIIKNKLTRRPCLSDVDIAFYTVSGKKK